MGWRMFVVEVVDVVSVGYYGHVWYFRVFYMASEG